MTNWFEDLLLSLLNVIPISTYRKGQAKRIYYQRRKSLGDQRRSFQKWVSAECKKLRKNRLLRKYMRRYSRGHLIPRDQRLFNGQILAAEAFKWDMDKILVFLTDATEDPEKFGVRPKHQKWLKDMIHLLLEHLKDPNLVPIDNHICKKKTGELDRITIDWEGVSLPCHSYYDILTVVLSILGRAPSGATRHSHHLALLIILAKFTIVIAGDKAKTMAPNLVSIMFIDETMDLDDLNVVMGATIPTHRLLKEEIRESRYKFLKKEGFFVLPGLHETWDKWLCGQCAETFAVVLLKRIITFSGKRVGGLSLKIRSVLEMDEMDDVKLEDLKDPCENCREELKQCNADLDQFQVSLMV